MSVRTLAVHTDCKLCLGVGLWWLRSSRARCERSAVRCLHAWAACAGGGALSEGPEQRLRTAALRWSAQVGGAPFLYADTFMQRDEFGKMFDLALYDKVRLERRLFFYNDINVCIGV